jgi:transposase
MPNSKQTIIGKINIMTGELEFNKKYLKYLYDNGIDIKEQLKRIAEKLHLDLKKALIGSEMYHLNFPSTMDINASQDNIANAESEKFEDNTSYSPFTIEDVRQSEVIHFGSSYLIEQLAKQIGLYQLIKEIFQLNANEILSLIYYLLSQNKPVYYLEDWGAYNLENSNNIKLNPQDISILLQRITHDKKLEFFEKWTSLRNEQEYLALDITSISSYSNLISGVEFGHNKENDKLPQINLCLLFGQQSRVPIYYTHYDGSLSDVVTLKSTLGQISFLNGTNFKLVMDKGFYSFENINHILYNMPDIKFLITVPFRKSYTNLFDKKAADIKENKYIIVCNDDVMHGKKISYKWDKNHTINAFFYYNPDQYHQKKDELYKKLIALKDKIYDDITIYDDINEDKKYFIIYNKKNYKKTGEYVVQLNHFAIENYLKNVGKMIILGNENNLSLEEALGVYRAKDVVEKGFTRYKSNLDLRRYRVHSSVSMDNKQFVCFLSQILLSYFDSKMSDANLYRSMSLQKYLQKFSSWRMHIIKGNRVLDHITKFQREGLKLFGIDIPDNTYTLLQ